MYSKNEQQQLGKTARQPASKFESITRVNGNAPSNECYEALNRVFRLTARHNDCPRNCRFKKCRTSSNCQSSHPLGSDCGTVNPPHSIYHDMIDNLDLLINVTGPLDADAFVDNRKDIRAVIYDLLKQKVFLKQPQKRGGETPWWSS